MDQWKDIPGYEGRYQASETGQIKSLIGASRVLKQSQTSKGYSCVCLRSDKKSKHWLVHRLIAVTFLGENPKLDINHKNGVKTDNRLENLEWCTRSENIRHAFKMGLSINHLWTLGKVGAMSGRSKPVIQKAKTGHEVARFTCIKEAAFTTGIAASGISAAATGRQKTAGKCLWEFE